MRQTFTVGVFRQKGDRGETWTALLPSAHRIVASGQSEARLREDLVGRLRDRLGKVPSAEQEQFHLHAGTRLHRVSIAVGARGPEGPFRIEGTYPLVCQPRWFDEQVQRLVVWHPLEPAAWFSAATLEEVIALAPGFARHAWAALGEERTTAMRANGKERLTSVSFSTEPRSLLDELPSRQAKRQRAGAPRKSGRVLPSLGVDQTARAIDGTLPLGVPREPYRTRLQHLLGGRQLRSTVLVGRPGSGKTTLLHRWIADRLDDEGYSLHRNLDRVRHVWRLSGKRIIAGMSYLGDWEQRCLDIVDDATRHQAILWIEDLHLFGRIGQSRQSDRSLADFFRGPIQRGQIAVVGELTPEQLQRLEDDAPSLAALLVRLPIAPTSPAETQALLLHELRELEQRLPVDVHPYTARTVIELAGALFPWTAMPGAAIDLLRSIGEDAAGRNAGLPRGERVPVGAADAIRLLSARTGLPAHLLTLEQPLDPAEVEAAFARRVIGQPAATRSAAEIVLDVRAGLADPGRPLAVQLFTGPTGTGKTELASALAEYLYGDPRRLIRLDMSELSGPDAVARLIGDRYQSTGLLTERIREQPFSVVLLDEIEKAHPAVLALLLQLFDEGRLTDAAGDTASFTHAVIVMTSNLGARPTPSIGFGESASAILADVARAVRDFFPPELWNRIDRVVPFSPLTAEVAAGIVDKELRKLLSRRGLRERDIFVYASPAVEARAVAEAFDPRWGARTVKRWLEDTVGTVLADAIGRGPAARMRVVRLLEQDGRVVALTEPMTERAPIDTPVGGWVLEPLLMLPALQLAAHAAFAGARADRALASPALPAAAEAARHGPRQGELQYFVEAARDRLVQLRDRLRPPPRRAAPDHDLTELETWSVDERVLPTLHDPVVVRTRRFDRRSVAGDGWRALDRDAALGDIARAHAYAGHLHRLADPDAHAATIELARVGHATAQGGQASAGDGLAFLAGRLGRAGWLDGFAVRHGDGHIVARGDGDGGDDPKRLVEALAGDPVHVVLVLRDLLIAPLVADEHGSHVLASVAAEPAIVRVQVTAGAPRPPRQVVDDHRARLAAFDAAVAAGGPLPPNPERLLPVVRAVTYAAPLRPGEPYRVEIEDFATGWTERLEVRALGDAIEQAWWLRWAGGAVAGEAEGPP